MPLLEANRIIQDSHPDYEKYKSTGRFVYDDYSEEEIKNINKILLDNCYRIKIKEDEDFYSVFFENLPKVKNKLGII